MSGAAVRAARARYLVGWVQVDALGGGAVVDVVQPAWRGRVRDPAGAPSVPARGGAARRGNTHRATQQARWRRCSPSGQRTPPSGAGLEARRGVRRRASAVAGAGSASHQLGSPGSRSTCCRSRPGPPACPSSSASSRWRSELSRVDSGPAAARGGGYAARCAQCWEHGGGAPEVAVRNARHEAHLARAGRSQRPPGSVPQREHALRPPGDGLAPAVSLPRARVTRAIRASVSSRRAAPGTAPFPVCM